MFRIFGVLLRKPSPILVKSPKLWYMLGSPKTNQLGNQVKHPLIILISFLLLSSFVTSCDKKEETLYRWETSSGIVWKRFGDKDTHRVYKGEWKNEKLNGLGVMTYPDGHKYVGEWKNGKYNGQGTSTYPDGGKYVGKFKDGKKNGQGTYTHPDGQKYVGRWKDDKRNGQGTFTYPDGQKYVGRWKDDKRNGQGTFTYPDGQKYVGGWKEGVRRNGTSYDENGNLKVRYVKGKRIKP